MIFFLFIFSMFFLVIIITVQICKFNITVSTQFLLLYITPYDAQASSAFRALINTVIDAVSKLAELDVNVLLLQFKHLYKIFSQGFN